MKKRSIYYSVFILGMALILTGCGIFSLHPLYHKEDLIVKTELIGTWKNSDDDAMYISIDTLEGKKYEFVIKDGEDTIKFKMGLLDLDGQYFIDLYPHDDCSFFGGDDCYALENLLRNYIPAHTFMKFDFTENEMTLTEFDNERLIKLFDQSKIRLDHEIPGEDADYVVITASTDDLQKFIKRYSNDDEAFNEPEKYYRL